jgi:Entner-Doudoroff aldolase
MIGKTEILNRLLACKVVTIARTDDPAGLAKAASAIRKGGLDVFEVTMGVPGAVEVLKDLSAQLAPEVLLGAGTVLDAETARAVILAGAQFIVTPAFNPEVVTMANRYGKAVVPGAFTPTEILSAWEAGADMVKVFPARMGGPAYIKDLLAPSAPAPPGSHRRGQPGQCGGVPQGRSRRGGHERAFGQKAHCPGRLRAADRNDPQAARIHRPGVRLSAEKEKQVPSSGAGPELNNATSKGRSRLPRRLNDEPSKR